MSDIALFFSLGWSHIISIDALDHILFVIALSAIYTLENRKAVLILITAFTIGHSLTLALSVYNIISIPDKWVEFLIPCTIVCTAIYNFSRRDFDAKKPGLNYLMALLFGFIHGMGFAGSIRFMLSGEEGIALPLLSFNIGLEVGQVFIILILLFINFVMIKMLPIKQKHWVWALSAIIFFISLNMAWDRLPY